MLKNISYHEALSINFTDVAGIRIIQLPVSVPWANVIKHFMAVSYDFLNKLECLSLASLSSLV